MSSFRKRGCKCKKKRCTCGAKWHYRYDIVDPVTGKRKQKETKGFKTKSEVEDEAKRIQYELKMGTYVEEKNTTFEDFAEEWLKIYEKTGRAKVSTLRVRKHEIGRLNLYLSKLKLKDITRKSYQDALDALFETGYAHNTIDGVHRTGRMIFKKAVELEMIRKDPTEYAVVPVKRATVEDLENEVNLPKYLEKEDLATFLKTTEMFGLDRDYVIFTILAYTGMRIGELCALKWSDVKQDTIRITKTYYNPTSNIKKYSLLPPKTKSSNRDIDIDNFVFEILDKHKTQQKLIQMKYRKTYHNKDFVIAQENAEYAGYPAYSKLIGNRMARLLKLAELNEALTPHSLRHTHTSLLAEAGVSLEQIMYRLGHSDDKTTKNIYLHVTKPKRKEASQKFGELMKGL